MNAERASRPGPLPEPMTHYAGRVLVIDDDPGLRELCALTLRGASFGVETLDTALAALETLERRSFDLIVLDLFMPGLDGLSLIEQLRARGYRTPILLISGQATVEDAARAMRLGARGLLLKPFAPDELRTTALAIVGERRAARSNDRAAALRPALQVGERLLGELDLPRLQDLIIETVRAELDADRASLMLLDEHNEWLHIAACSGLPVHIQVGHRTRVSESLAGRVAMRREPVRVLADGEVSPPAENVRGELSEDEIVSALSVPVLAGERVLGVLNAAKVRSSPPFSEADKELLLLLAAQAAIAIENARLYSAVAQSEARYRALLQHANDAVLLLDMAGQAILDTNLALEQLSGYSRAELLELGPRQLLPSVDDLLAAAGRNGRESHEIELELRTRHDQALPVAASVSVVPHAGQHLLLVIARDISERQRIAKQLVQAEKLAALGRLSASLAHEINNPLQAIHNSVHLLLSRPLSEEKQLTYLTMTQEEIERLISIVQRMLDFYRPSREGMRPVEVNDILDAVLPLIEGQALEHGVRVLREEPIRLPRVFAISNHLKQVCFNLVFNAVEAMPEGGELRIRAYLASEDAPDPQEASYVAVSGGRGSSPVEMPAVVIEVSDTGMGIPPHDLPKIFEPFYTTRTKGTGLGLAVSYSIIEQHHGELAVRSQVGEGTTFRIRLPVAQ
jgi:two-component system, NtrC family, sensor kinase